MESVDPEPDDWTDPECVRELDQQLEYTPPTPEQRLLDVLGSTICLVVTSPVFLIVSLYYLGRSLLVRDSPSAFQTERRISEGEPFQLYKFRTLANPARIGDSNIKDHEDAEKTTVVGRALIQVYLDELPQLYNVLRGDMRLVGPRPWAVQDAEQERESTGLRRKFLARAGLTGPDQVQKGYPDRHTAYEGDYRYLYRQQCGSRIERLKADLKLLGQSIVPVLKAEGK